MRDLGYYEEAKPEGDVGGGAASQLVCKTLYAWREAVSPHLAAERESGVVEDTAVLEMLQKCLRFELEGGGEMGKETEIFCVVETAGGVASPGPSGSLQCDLYRYLNLSSPGLILVYNDSNEFCEILFVFKFILGAFAFLIFFKKNWLTGQILILLYFKLK